jgi:YD repeat-containing protein
VKAIIRISIASFFLMILCLPAAHAETLQEQLNNLVGPKQKYNTMLSPVYLRTNETIDDISPQSGSLTITQTDFVLPGRNGLDLVFKRIYKNDTASVQEMEVEYIDGAWVDIARSNNRTTSFYEDRYNLGIGMRFSFPNMEIKTNSDGSSHKFLHTESGDVYRLKENYVDGSFGYLPEGQTVKDVVVRESAAYSNGQTDGTSKYVMAGKDGKKTYFAEDGRILGIVDRYGNTIRFEYATHTYNIEGESIPKKLMSKITDSVGRVSTIEYVEDANYTVGPINNQTSYGAEDYYKASGNPNNNDSGDLKGKFQVILHLPGDKSMIYDKSAVLVSPSKHVIRTRLQRVFDTDSKPKFLLWYEQPDLGFTYFNNTSYSAYNRYENLVLVDDVKNNSMKRFVYNTYTKRLNEGSMQYRKIFESKSLVKKGFDPAPSNFLDKFIVDTKDKITYTYTNEADGYGVTDYKGNDEAYLKGNYRYYTQITDVNGSSTRFTYNGNQELILTEKQGRDHKEVVKSEHDEMKLVKKQETVKYQVTNGQPSNNSVKKIENFRYDEYGNMTNYTGPDAERDASGYPVNNERSVLYTYDINKFHILTQKTWKQDKNTTAQINYSLDEKGNVIKESKSGNDVVNSWINTDFAYDSYGNLIRKTVHDKAQDFVTWFEYGTDANGLDTKGAYLTKEYRQSGGKTYAKTYAYDFQTGNLLSEIDPRGNKTSYQYDVLGRVVKNTKPDQAAQEYQYQNNVFGNFKILYTDVNQIKFLYEYDIKGSLLNSKVLSQGKWNNLESMEYDSFGNLIKKVDANGHSTRFTYDSNQQIVEKSSYENDKTIKGTLKVDYQIGSSPEVPLLMTITNEEGYAKKYNYDILDRLIKEEVTPDRQKLYASTNTYDYAGNIVIETDDAKHTTQYTYDTQGRKTSETDALGNITEYAYNNLDQKVSEKAPGGKITEWIYDDFGNNTVQKVYQSGSEDYFYTQIEYDGNQNPVKNTVGLFSNGANRDSSIVTFAYDGLNRVTDEYNRLDATSTTHTHADYDAKGNKLKVIDYGDSAGNRLLVRNFEYDYAGRVTLESGAAREKQADGKQIERGKYETRNEYDLAGNLLKKQIYNGSGYDTEENVYNYRNQVISTTSPFNAKGTKIKRFQYDKVGNLIAETAVISGTERTTSYTYDGLGYKTVVTDALGNSTRYEYDIKGNPIKMVDPRYYNLSIDQAPGVVYEYDPKYRLIKTTSFNGSESEVIEFKVYDGRNNVIKHIDGEGYNWPRCSVSASGMPEHPEGLVVVRPGEGGDALFLIHEFSGRDVYFPALGMHIEGRVSDLRFARCAAGAAATAHP